jgi:methylenetetrahydrofolate dehydrogenase (NADP+)/methenyltetrahydrofolate cyclohydrolase
MAAKILGGKQIAEAIKAEIRAEVAGLREVHGIAPCLAVVRVGDDPSSAVYVVNKIKTSEELGLRSIHHHLPRDTDTSVLLELVRELNEDDHVDGILVQLPLPPQIDEGEVLEAVNPEKDVDGFHPVNVGRLSQGREALVPCTPAGVIAMLGHSDIPIEGQHAVIVGRSNIVGKPMAMLLLQENATVTICHSRTQDLPSITRQADILIAAIGRPGFIRGEHVKEGATVIDVGINKLSNADQVRAFYREEEIARRLEAIEKRGFTLIGDVHPADAMQKAGAYTPVPGGVGLLTIAMLMRNTVDAAKRRRRLNEIL